LPSFASVVFQSQTEENEGNEGWKRRWKVYGTLLHFQKALPREILLQEEFCLAPFWLRRLALGRSYGMVGAIPRAFEKKVQKKLQPRLTFGRFEAELNV
jgi:hypothetical protein